jgi:very-short-patch-repair endonuclease
MALSHLLPIIVLLFAALLVISFKFLKFNNQGTRWPVKARLPVSPVEQQLFRRLIDAFPQSVVLSQVAVSQLVSVLPGPGRQVAFNKISRLVADFVLCTTDFSVTHVIELDDNSHAAPHRKNADRNKSEALAAAGYSLVRFQASKLPTVAELQAALPVPASNIVAISKRRQSASTSGKTKSPI